ncbi:hypothetical protein EII25_04295 [Erysipelotrichaceae bacterium OH741_COT-311]|nr:hypothetical protein EII25_04295 [Erysipelotrichaceae bacterium OH741_COT-311]
MYKSQARGQLLEIVLEKLIEVNGYKVINEGEDVEEQNNGLNVRGRGGFHQCDSLGEFKITPPFMYPLRLFVEAKFYEKEKVGIEKVRMGIGILQDVNTNYSTCDMDYNQLNLTRYDYHYALFSTSGFTFPAQRMALAHKIGLIDLSNGQLSFIKSLIRDIVNLLFDNVNISEGVFNQFKKIFKNIINNHFEDYSCKLYEMSRLLEDSYFLSDLERLINDLVNQIQNQSIYLASIRSSQIIALIPKNNEDFKLSLKRNPHQSVSINWEDHNGDWIVRPEDQSYELIFKLPELLVRELSQNLENIEANSMAMKESVLATMSFVAYLDNQNPTLCTLKFDKEMTLGNINRFNT